MAITENIENTFFDALETNNVPYDRESAKKNLEAWDTAKAPLIEFLSRHAKWNPDLMAIAVPASDSDPWAAFVISVNPADFITMSNGDGWRTNQAPGRSLQANALAYMNDATTMVVYTTANPHPTYNTPKRTRCLFSYDIENCAMYQAKLFPGNTTDDRLDYRIRVQHVLAELIGGEEPDSWKHTSNAEKIERRVKTHYGAAHLHEIVEPAYSDFAMHKSVWNENREHDANLITVGAPVFGLLGGDRVMSSGDITGAGTHVISLHGTSVRLEIEDGQLRLTVSKTGN